MIKSLLILVAGMVLGPVVLWLALLWYWNRDRDRL